MKIFQRIQLLSLADSVNGISIKNVTSFVPKYKPPNDQDILKLHEFLSSHEKIVVITGAGISTESGIPDYRSAGVGLYARSNSRPMKIQDFMKSEDSRKR